MARRGSSEIKAEPERENKRPRLVIASERNGTGCSFCRRSERCVDRDGKAEATDLLSLPGENDPPRIGNAGSISFSVRKKEDENHGKVC